jgi:hypothetical protein
MVLSYIHIVFCGMYVLGIVICPVGARLPVAQGHRSGWNAGASSTRIRGGSISDELSVDGKIEKRDYDEKEKWEGEEDEVVEEKPPTSIIISTSVGSIYLDKKRRISVPANSTVGFLKEQLSSRFPGSPPRLLQRIFFGTQMLSDDTRVDNVTSLSPVPLTLDMMTGTSVYNRTMTVTQALEAYAAAAVQQAYTGQTLHKIFDEKFFMEKDREDKSDIEGDTTPQTVRFREMFLALNASIYENFADEIGQALLAEREPEAYASDTAAWRSTKGSISPVAAAFAKEFDLNWNGAKNFVYFTALLILFAKFGTNTSASSTFLITMIPFLWVTKLRQARLASKVLLYFLLPFVSLTKFLTPLLPAPYLAIAMETKNEILKRNDLPIVPESKYRGAGNEQDEDDYEEDDDYGSEEDEDEDEEEEEYEDGEDENDDEDEDKDEW